MTKWQPIETAPRDGTEILIYARAHDAYGRSYAPGLSVGWWSVEDECWYDRGCAAWTEPTHWVPLPEPPSE